MDWPRRRNQLVRRVFGNGLSGKAKLAIITSLFCLTAFVFASIRFQIEEATAAAAAVSNEVGSGPVPPQGFPQGQHPSQVSEVELITITPDGFQPAAITRPSGLFAIAYENYSGMSSVSPRIDAQSGVNLHHLSMSLLTRAWIGEFNLAPGKYFIRELSHPDWSCVLTIE